MNRILAIQVKQIGDVILTLPALRLLRRRFPEAEITFAVAAPAAGLAPLFACVDRVVGIGKGRFEPAIWKHAAGRRYDAALDFSGTDRARFLSFLSRAPVRAGYPKHARGFLGRRVYTRAIDVALREHHTIDYFIRLLAALGIEPAEEPLTATLPPPDQLPATRLPAELSAALEEEEESGRTTSRHGYAVIHPGTARPEKYWLPDRWARVIEHLATDHGLTPVITGAAGREEEAHVEQIKTEVAKQQIDVIDLVGKLDLLDSARVISGCRLFLGVDTAAMHLASAFQRPLVALFGPTNPFRWRPRNPEARILLAGQESPVSRYRIEDETGDMSAISTPAVLGALDELLAGDPRLPPATSAQG